MPPSSFFSPIVLFFNPILSVEVFVDELSSTFVDTFPSPSTVVIVFFTVFLSTFFNCTEATDESESAPVSSLITFFSFTLNPAPSSAGGAARPTFFSATPNPDDSLASSGAGTVRLRVGFCKRGPDNRTRTRTHNSYSHHSFLLLHRSL